MSKTTTVVYILSSASRYDGSSKAILNMLEGLSLKGVSPFVVLPDSGTICTDLDLRKIPYVIVTHFGAIYPRLVNLRDSVLYFPRFFRTLYSNYTATVLLIDLLKKNRPDLIHTNVGPVHFGLKVAKKLRIPHVWHVREYQDLDFNMQPLPTKRNFIKKLRSINNYPVAITQDVFNHFRMGNNAKVIYDGVLKRSNTRFVLEKGKYFLFAGRLEENKGIANLIYAFSDFTKEIKNYKLFIAGDTPDVRYKRKILSHVKEKNLDEFVNFLGMRDDICDLMANATALIVPSVHEGFGFITVEAMFNGCLVIGNNTSGTKEILEKENLGILYSGHEELVEAMKTVVENGIESYYPKIKKAQERAKELYSLEQNADAIYSLYQKIINI